MAVTYSPIRPRRAPTLHTTGRALGARNQMHNQNACTIYHYFLNLWFTACSLYKKKKFKVVYSRTSKVCIFLKQVKTI